MDDHAVLRPAGFREQAAERIAGWIGQMGLRQKGIAERQPGGKAVFLRQRQNRARSCLPQPTRPPPQMQPSGAP